MAPIAILTITLMLPAQAFAASLTATETVANVAVATVPAITTAGGAAAVNATSTISFPAKASIVNNDYFILTDAATAGDAVCFYFDINNSLASDAGTAAACQAADGVAGGVELAVSAATDAASVALIAHTAINAQGATLLVTSTNNLDGSLLLTHDTAGTAGNIALNAAYMTEAIATGGTLTALTGGAAATAASVTIAITGALVAGAADQSVNIDALGAIALGAVAQTAAEVAATIRAGLTGAAGYAAKDYGVTGAGANIIFTRESTGTAGNGAITITDGNYSSKAQVVVFTPSDVDGDDSYTVTINGTAYVQNRGADNVKEVVDRLGELMAADAAVSCSEDDTALTCTARTAGTAFTYSTGTEKISQSSSGSGGGGGGGGSSRRETARSNASATVAGTPASTNAASTASASIFARDVTVGATGEDIRALQVYLNAKGFTVAPSGAGSAGSETTMFGGLTRAALAKFQAAHGIMPSAGYFGPKTRAYVAANP